MTRAKNLVVVESPTKARTIGRFLGKDYVVKASVGHIRDLPENKIGVDLDGSFQPRYVIPKEKRPVIKELNEAVEAAEVIYLATDPDREGEAIAWHLTEATKDQIDGKPVRRVVFHEITGSAVREAFAHPREIDHHLVDAQQARRVLDRIVGYKLSPFLWQKVQRGLSAGRVQSAALRILADREREIAAFVPQEYWRVIATFAKRATADGQQAAFAAELKERKGADGKIQIGNEAEAKAITGDLANASYAVATVKQRETQSAPRPPFTTSTLQQEAWNKLRFSAGKTMTVAQQLYEGLPVGAEGPVGLITYMRTDSVTVTGDAIQEARKYIQQRYGAPYAPEAPRFYTTKAQHAQEAHEAIRPTSIARDPEAIKQHLSPDQYKLYGLIWKRMVASQMSNAVFDATTVEIESGGAPSGTVYIFKADGKVQRFAGFLLLYQESSDSEEDQQEGALPPLAQGEPLDLAKPLDPQQKFTQPPPRYTEARLVKELEDKGIGRPSTYASIISTLTRERGYVVKEKGSLRPVELGLKVDEILRASFPDVVDLQFTARMEEGLDEIAEGAREWVPYLRGFYGPFETAVAKATNETCEKCGKPMAIKDGRFGPFLACTGYPECRNTKPIRKADEPSGESCEKCGKPMLIKHGRYGAFLGCSGYPECKNIKPLAQKVGIPCPKCGGDIVEKSYRKGKVVKRFYGCANYPKCDFATSLKPIAEPRCPKCSGLLGAFQRGGVACTQCDYRGRLPRRPKAGEEPEPSEPAAEPAAQAEPEEPEAVAARG